MAFSDITEFPRGYVHIAALSDTAKQIAAADGPTLKICYFVISGGAADEIVIFRDADDSPEQQRVAVPSGATVVIPGFQTTTEGLEVVCASSAGDITVTARTVEPTRTNVA